MHDAELSVSVITPSFNQGQYIEETIQSVLAQDVAKLEYLVVDGGSTDETLAILHQYQDRMQWLSEADQGQADAVNKGIQRTRGDIIGWLNSDDIYYPHAIARVCQFFKENPEVDVVYGKAHQLDASGNRVFEDYLTEPWNFERLKVCCILSQPATFFRRRVVERYGSLNPQLHLCLDYEYWLRLSLRGACFAYLPEVLAAARLYPETKSSQNYVQAHVETINMLHQILGSVPLEWLINYSTAKAKTEFCYTYPHPQFILKSWLNLWEAAGYCHQGFDHFRVWLAVQQMMMKKLFIKTFKYRAKYL